MINFPIKPWADGQQFSPEPGVTGTYSASKNAWSFVRAGNVNTSDVLTVDVRPDDEGIEAARSLFEGEDESPRLATQQDINWYLYELINSKL